MWVDNYQKIGELLFFGSFVGDSIAFVLLTAAILVMHFLMPKELLDKYFKPPYFSESECVLISGIPLAPLRSIMFMRAIAYPRSGKKRGIKDAFLLVSSWYRLISKLIVIGIIAVAFVIIFQMISFWLLFIFHKTPT